MGPPVLVLHATGTNRDREAAYACELAGGVPEILHMNQLVQGERRLGEFRMLVLPGGFSYGDDLGAGRLWAVNLRYRLADQLRAFVGSGRPVLGICNGFQALVRTGLLPGLPDSTDQDPPATLTRNDSARFECRWVYLAPEPESPCLFTRGLDEPILCPVAHGEGKLALRDEAALDALEEARLPALRYVDPEGRTAAYPWNPNGSAGGIAGLTNPRGNVLGLMPHPEDHVLPEQHPRYHRGEGGLDGLRLFANGVRHAAQL